jgi:hypothetical protein
MSTQEYLSVLVAIVLGLGLTHLLAGFGRLIVERHRVRFYWLSLLQALVVFLATMHFWWSTPVYGEQVESNFFAFLFFLLSPIALYLLSVLVVPDLEGESEGAVSLKDHYFSVRQWYFGIGAILPVLNALRNVLVQDGDVWNEDRPFELAFTVLMLSGLLVRGERWHAVLAVLGLAMFTMMILLISLQPG